MANDPIDVRYEFSLIPECKNHLLKTLEPRVKDSCLTAACHAPTLYWRFCNAQNRDLICLYASSDFVVEFTYDELTLNNMEVIESRIEAAFVNFQPS